MMIADFIFWPAVAVMVGCSLYFRPRISNDRIAMQWGVNGEPTWHAPKAIGLWGVVGLALAVRVLIGAAMTYAPERVHGAETGLLLFSIIVAAAHVLTLRAAVRAN